MIYLFENLIFSPKKREEITHILTMAHPSHEQRLFLRGFLSNVVHMNNDDIFSLIKRHNNWTDFDEAKTEKQVYGTNCYKSKSTYTWDKNHDECKDTSIFSKLNNSFFNETLKTAYEYAENQYNIFGKMRWEATTTPVYRVTDGKTHFLYYIDIDSTPEHLGDAWNIAKQIHDLDSWDFFKFSGNKGFHLAKRTTQNRQELAEKTKEIYKAIRTNLISYTTDADLKKEINIDPSSLWHSRFIRGYCLNLKSKKYSIPVDTSMHLSEILDISSDLTKIKPYLQTY